MLHRRGRVRRAADLSSDELIAAPTRPAYRAKHEGKNRACEA
jgi:PleD family two-component response regulator